LLSDKELLNNAKKVASNIMVMTKCPDKYLLYEENINNIYKTSINDNEDNLFGAFSMIISMLFFIALMTVNTTIGNMATDSICGEKERGTFDFLVLSGTKISSIFSGKMLFVSLVGLVVLIINCIVLYFGINIFVEDLGAILAERLSGQYFWIMPLIILLAGISVLETSLFFALSVHFNNVKQAMSYMGIVQIFLSLFSYAPNILNENYLQYVPIGNFTIVLEKIVKNEMFFNALMISSFIVLVISIPLFAYSVKILNQNELKK
jgi:ABC-type Na+ efflux pump permease subunit